MDISKIKIGSTTYDIKDSVAREALSGLSGAMHWLGMSAVAMYDGDTGRAIISTGQNSSITYYPPNDPNAEEGSLFLQPGDAIGAPNANDINGPEIELVWNGSKWQEFGSTGSLGALAYANSASTTYTPAGTNASSAVTLTGGATSKLVTTTVTGVSGSTTASKTTSGSSKLVTTTITGTDGTETVSKVTKTASKLVTTSITGVNGSVNASKIDSVSNAYLDTTTVPNVTANTAVSIPNVTENTSVTIPNVTNVGSASTWGFDYNDGTLEINNTSTGYSSGNGSAPTLGTALIASKVTLGTALSASKVTLGTAITVATGTASQNGSGETVVTTVNHSGVQAAKAGSTITVATGAVDALGAGSDIVTAVTVSDKTVAKAASSATTVATGQLASNGSGASVVNSVTATDVTVPVAASGATTVATGQVNANGAGATVATALRTGGTAAGQTFIGTQATITVAPVTT